MAKTWTSNTPYEKRQIYAADADVPIETCMECPYFKPVNGGGLNIHGQPGVCCYCRHESKMYNMTGKANCLN